MMIRSIVPAVLCAAAFAAVPTGASAQSFGIYFGSEYPAYRYYDGYRHDGRWRTYDEERREAWLSRDRWERHVDWERRERWREEEAVRRRWEAERWEHRRQPVDDDEDDR